MALRSEDSRSYGSRTCESRTQRRPAHTRQVPEERSPGAARRGLPRTPRRVLGGPPRGPPQPHSQPPRREAGFPQTPASGRREVLPQPDRTGSVPRSDAGRPRETETRRGEPTLPALAAGPGPCCFLSQGGGAPGPSLARTGRPGAFDLLRTGKGARAKLGLRAGRRRLRAGNRRPSGPPFGAGRRGASLRARSVLRPPRKERRHRAAASSAASPGGVWAQVSGVGGRALCWGPGHPHVLPRCHSTPQGTGDDRPSPASWPHSHADPAVLNA